MSIIKKITSNKYYFAIFELVVFSLFVFLIYGLNPYNILKYENIIIPIILIVAVIMIICFFYVQIRDINDLDIEKYTIFKLLFKLFFVLGFFTISICCLYFIGWCINRIPSVAIINYTIAALLLITTVALFYILTKPLFMGVYKRNTSFVTKSMFYIPLTFVTLTQMLNKKLNLSDDPTLTLIIFEVILISLYFCLPYIGKYIYKSDSIEILRKPVYLNKLTKDSTLGNFNKIHKSYLSKKDKKYQHIYSVSLWYYINPQQLSTNHAYSKDSNILNYGNKPSIVYNAKDNAIIIYTQLNRNDIDEPKLIYTDNNVLLQRWNNMVINYDDGFIDIFINAVLVHSFKNVSPFMSYETFILGERHGIHGGICNVKYYNRKLSKNDILLDYKILSNKLEPFL